LGWFASRLAHRPPHFICLDLHRPFAYSFSHFAQRGQTVAGVRAWPFNAMHGAGPAATFT
jgi:hypothetical protein